MADPTPFELTRQGAAQIVSNGAASLTLLEGDAGRLFRRRAVKAVGTEQAHRVEWAVA